MSTPDFLIYQLGYSERECGKRHPDSKIEVSWRYSIDSEQHQVVLIWSFHSGKQSVMVDGAELYCGCAKGASIFDQKIKTRDQLHEMQIVGSRTKPNNARNIFRCYELIIDGKSFFSYPNNPNGSQGNKSTQFFASGGDEGQMSSILDLLYPDIMKNSYSNQSQNNRSHDKGMGVPDATPVPFHMYDQQPVAASPTAYMSNPHEGEKQVDFLDLDGPAMSTPTTSAYSPPQGGPPVDLWSFE